MKTVAYKLYIIKYIKESLEYQYFEIKQSKDMSDNMNNIDFHKTTIYNMH